MGRPVSERTKAIEACLRQVRAGRNRWPVAYLAAVFGVSHVRVSVIRRERGVSRVGYAERLWQRK